MDTKTSAYVVWYWEGPPTHPLMTAIWTLKYRTSLWSYRVFFPQWESGLKISDHLENNVFFKIFFTVIDAFLRATSEMWMALETQRRRHSCKEDSEKINWRPLTPHHTLAGHRPLSGTKFGNSLPCSCVYPISGIFIKLGQTCVTF